MTGTNWHFPILEVRFWYSAIVWHISSIWLTRLMWSSLLGFCIVDSVSELSKRTVLIVTCRKHQNNSSEFLSECFSSQWNTALRCRSSSVPIMTVVFSCACGNPVNWFRLLWFKAFKSHCGMNTPVSVYNEFIDSKWLYGVVVYGLGCRGLHSPTGRLQLPDLNLSGVVLLE